VCTLNEGANTLLPPAAYIPACWARCSPQLGLSAAARGFVFVACLARAAAMQQALLPARHAPQGPLTTAAHCACSCPSRRLRGGCHSGSLLWLGGCCCCCCCCRPSRFRGADVFAAVAGAACRRSLAVLVALLARGRPCPLPGALWPPCCVQLPLSARFACSGGGHVRKRRGCRPSVHRGCPWRKHPGAAPR
jgi:hypothetical protein